jgi:hypothetical protein
VDTEILDLVDNCNHRSLSEISSVQACDSISFEYELERLVAVQNINTFLLEQLKITQSFDICITINL